jgi:hypothetical protein
MLPSAVLRWNFIAELAVRGEPVESTNGAPFDKLRANGKDQVTIVHCGKSLTPLGL